MTNRQVIRCPKCQYNQFVTKSGNCRKCGDPYPLGVVSVEWLGKVRKPQNRHIAAGCEVGASVAAMRKLFGWTQQQLADKCNMARTSISRMENCDSISLGMSIVECLANALGSSVLALLLGPEACELLYRFEFLDENQQQSVCVSAKAMSNSNWIAANVP